MAVISDLTNGKNEIAALLTNSFGPTCRGTPSFPDRQTFNLQLLRKKFINYPLVKILLAELFSMAVISYLTNGKNEIAALLINSFSPTSGRTSVFFGQADIRFSFT